MKKNLIFLLPFTLTLCCTPPQKPVEKTTIGFFTPYNFMPETVNNKVKELKELNFWAVEKDGAIEAGALITLSDRDSLINWTNDFSVHFDESGLPDNIIYLDENSNSIGRWEVINENNTLKSAKFIEKDTVNTTIQNTVESDGSFYIKRYAAETDSLKGESKIEFNADKKYSKIQMLNSKGEPTFKYEYTYDEKGNLSNYNWSREDTIRGGMNFTYNDKGFTESQEVFNKITGKSSIYTYKYEYDDVGNWVKQIAYKEGEPKVVCKREYIYY